MKSSILRRTQIARVAACAVLLNFSVPGGALAVYGAPLRENVAKGLEDRAKAEKGLAARRVKSASRLLTGEEERTLQGRAGENPYLAGQNKWDVVYKGIDLMTGNFSTSATDLSFDGGYGIPVNVTRSYSSNNPDEGPFGKGWTLSADVRSTAGGLIKSAGAPAPSVPTSLKERSAGEDDPNVAVEPAAAVTAVDAGGTEETIQKDVDGILTTPAWDKNVYDSVYEWVEFPAGSGAKTQLLVSNSVKTPEGTVYAYAKKGSYPNGTRPWNDPSAAPEAANVLKVTSATDRHGNVTTYTYGNTPVSFQKSNGSTSEMPLTGVSMPGGHVLAFAWGTSGNAQARIVSITDNPGAPAADQRVVQYGYGAGGLLTSVTTPGLRTTQYGYTPSASGDPNAPDRLLNAVTNARGLTTSLTYTKKSFSYLGSSFSSFFVTAIYDPNQVYAVVTATVSKPTDRRVDVYRPDGSLMRSDYLDQMPNGNGGLRIELRPGTGTGGQGNLVQWRNFDRVTQDLAEEGSALPSNVSARFNLTSGQGYSQVVTNYARNFMGAPLTATLNEYKYNGQYLALVRTGSVEYAYWTAERYFQQKAVRDQAGRVSFTDYYPNTASAGCRGQVVRVFDAKRGGITGTTGTNWRYTVAVSDPSRCVAAFHDPSDSAFGTPSEGASGGTGYDAKGRPTDVWKLQKAPSNGAWTRVRTHTVYGSDGGSGGTWGQASQVVEDYGDASHINRTTQSMGYTPWGKVRDVLDAAGRRFVTTFDKDGLVLGVTRTDQGGNQPIVTYGYGTSGVSNGQPTSVTDGLSGVVQEIGYVASGGGIGQPGYVKETNGGDVYRVDYTYGLSGDRATMAQADNGTTVARWGYSDYVPVNDFGSSSRAFRTMVRLDVSTGAPTTEEFHYAYDPKGRLVATAFAQTPQSGSPSANGYYDGRNAASRAWAEYQYDAAGRLTDVSTYWDAQGQSSVLIAQNTCGYEISTNGSNLNRGLKTSSLYAMQGEQTRTETYGYDPKNDELTEAHYGDGTWGFQYPDEAWSYDAAGNRGGNAVDSLNRATTAGGLTCTNDILGNRTSKTNSSGLTFFYNWDALNRLTAHGRAGAWSASYGYRADGMRISKLYNGVATRFRHAGQMAIEDVETPASGNPTITRYGLGGRGVDFMEQTAPNNVVTRGFPIYDAHGNNVATLYRNGTGYAVQNLRRYSAWGNVRGGSPTGDPKGKYCANLGHRQDDESGLTYMRARYYEPDSARFLSQDRSRDGSNWFAYCGNDPVNNADQSGNDAESITIKMNNVMLEVALILGSGGSRMGMADELYSLLDIMIEFTGEATEAGIQARATLESVKSTPTADGFTAEQKTQQMTYWAGEAGKCYTAHLLGKIYQYEINVAITGLEDRMP